MPKVKKNKLTIYLIRQGFDSIESIVNLDNKNVSEHTFEGVGRLYICRSPNKSPKWIHGFFGDQLNPQDWRISSISAVLIVSIDVNDNSNRLFALTFGYGRTWLANEAVERRFGLKCVLNSIGANSLRQIRKTLVSGNARKSSEQMPRKAAASEFSLDYEQDLLESVTAVGNSGSPLEGSITGADSLTVSTSVKLNKITDFLRDVFSIYQSNTYKEHFSWIDHIAPVKDKNLISRLEECAVKALLSGDKSVWFAVPVVIEWETIIGFRYTPQGETFDDILTEDVLGALKSSLVEFEQLKQKRVLVIDSTTNEVRESWPVSRCLYGEIQLESEEYCITDGRWYKVDNTYSDTINRDYETTKISDIVFPDYTKNHNGEKDYNKELADSSNTLLLMDRENIPYGGGRSRIELCDVLSSDGKLIHVKRYGGSSVMSHLFNQGLISMDLIKSEPSFVEKANQSIAQKDPQGAFAISDNSTTEVVYGIVTSDNSDLPNIPFFSKVAFHHVKKRLKTMGVAVSIGAIHEANKID